MLSDDPPSRHYELDDVADLEWALDERGIEHLDVNTSRTFVLYREAILNLIVTDGVLSAARAVTIECWEVSPRATDPGPEAVLAALCDEVVAASDTDPC